MTIRLIHGSTYTRVYTVSVKMAIKKGKYLNFGHSAHATNENDLTDVGLADLCVLHGLVARVDALLDQVTNN